MFDIVFEVIVFDNGFFGRQILLLAPDTNRGDDQSKLWLRMFDWQENVIDGQHICKFFCRQIEQSRNEKCSKIVKTEEYDMGEYRPQKPFHSCGKVVFIFRAVTEASEDLQKLVVYDVQSGSLEFFSSKEEFWLQMQLIEKTLSISG